MEFLEDLNIFNKIDYKQGELLDEFRIYSCMHSEAYLTNNK